MTKVKNIIRKDNILVGSESGVSLGPVRVDSFSVTHRASVCSGVTYSNTETYWGL